MAFYTHLNCNRNRMKIEIVVRQRAKHNHHSFNQTPIKRIPSVCNFSLLFLLFIYLSLSLSSSKRITIHTSMNEIQFYILAKSIGKLAAWNLKFTFHTGAHSIGENILLHWEFSMCSNQTDWVVVGIFIFREIFPSEKVTFLGTFTLQPCSEIDLKQKRADRRS